MNMMIVGNVDRVLMLAMKDIVNEGFGNIYHIKLQNDLSNSNDLFHLMSTI